MVKFLDLKKQYESIKDEIDSAIKDVIENTAFIGGARVKDFEASFASFVGTKYCVGCGNGTDALEIALDALNLPKGSEIIVPVNSFVASSEAITRAGYRVVFCNYNSDDYLIDIKDLESKITDSTSAILCVHLYGMPCDMDALLDICKSKNLKLIEDCAQAHGAKYKGKGIGTFGDIATFSFYPGKNLGAYGDGGAIVTDSPELEKKCRMIANHGRIDKYNHEFEGRNSRLDGLQAAVLSVKLKHLNDWVKSRNEVAKKYIAELSDVKGLKLQSVSDEKYSAYHLFVLRCKQRDALKAYLAEKDIQSGIHYPILLANLNAYDYLNQDEWKDDTLGSELLSIPMGEHLEDSEIDLVISVVKEFFEK